MKQSAGSADSHLIGYRADIDGLRAVAVLAVVAFHAVKGVMPGGYNGVDIFFVLSGFLITGIIQRELDEGCFTVRRFYERRIRRILPALLVMMLAATAVAVAVLLPADLIGTTVLDQSGREFAFRPGPVFANLLLADEINRTPPNSGADPDIAAGGKAE
jgi:peptidoglycan/LPS O-acetylase OafA/YrhL